MLLNREKYVKKKINIFEWIGCGGMIYAPHLNQQIYFDENSLNAGKDGTIKTLNGFNSSSKV